MGDFGANTVDCRIDLANVEAFALGALRVDPARRQVCRNGACQELQPRVMQVLVALAGARGGVVSRDRLIAQCWEGRIVGDDALTRCVVALRALGRDLGEGSFEIETVPRIGYALIERPTDPAAAAQAASGRTRPRLRGLAAVLLAALALAAAAGFAWWRFAAAPAEPASIAVLPFRSLSPGDGLLAEGVAEEIMNRLGHQPGLRVAGRTSSALFKGGGDLRDIGRRLEVGYVLEGTFRRAGGRIQVDVSLVGTGDGMLIWSDGYAGTADDIFDIQRRVGDAVARRLQLQLAGRPAAAPPETSGEVHSLYLTAHGLIRTRDFESNRTAIQLLRRAVRLDPDYAPAWADLAKALYLEDVARNPEGEAAAAARRAVALRPDLAQGHAALGLILGARGRPALERAVQLDPGDAEAWVWLTGARAADFDFEGEHAAIRRAAAIDPFWIRANQAADVAWQLGDRAEALAIDRGLIARHPLPGHRELARARIAMRSGDWSGYVAHLARAAELDPDLRSEALWSLRWTLMRLGLPMPHGVNLVEESPLRLALAEGRAPPVGTLAHALGGARAFWTDQLSGPLAIPLLLRQGRAADLVRLYDEAFRSPEAFLAGGEYDSIDLEAPALAIALRGAGRSAEADRLLALAAQPLAAAARRPHVTGDALGRLARIRAVQGRRGEAMTLLERARAMGWPAGYEATPFLVHAGFDEDPAYAALRAEPRFRRLAAEQTALIERERRETVASGVLRGLGR